MGKNLIGPRSRRSLRPRADRVLGMPLPTATAFTFYLLGSDGSQVWAHVWATP